MNKTSIIFSGLLMAVSVSALAAKDIDISSSHWKKSRHTHKRKRHETSAKGMSRQVIFLPKQENKQN